MNPNISLEKLLAQVDSIYKLVVMAAKRAGQLNLGSPRLVESTTRKFTILALEETAAGKVKYKPSPSSPKPARSPED